MKLGPGSKQSLFRYCSMMQHGINGSVILDPPVYTVGKMPVNASTLQNDQEIWKKKNLWKSQLIQQENS